MTDKIKLTGHPVIDDETATLARRFGDTGMSEQESYTEAERIRDTLLGAAIDAIRLDRHATIPTHTAWTHGNERAEQVVRGLTGNFGCRCTGWDGCPKPTACGTPNGCHCGA